MRPLGPHRYRAGESVGRWTVVRAAADAVYAHGRQHVVTYRRVLVRCVCGHEAIVCERQLTRGRSLGCRGAHCRWVWTLRQEVAEVEMLAAHHETAAASARARLAAAKAKLTRLEAQEGTYQS